jgi:hypothetical protein
MAPTETELLRLALLAYEAASAPGLWDQFLKRYNESVHGDISLIPFHDLDRENSTILSGFGITLPFQQSYDEHYSLAAILYQNRNLAPN